MDLRVYSVHVRTMLSTESQERVKGAYGSLVIRYPAPQNKTPTKVMIPTVQVPKKLEENIVRKAPMEKQKTENCITRGMYSNRHGMAHRLRPCAYNSRFLASSSGSWSVPKTYAWLDSQCFKKMACPLTTRTEPMLAINNMIAVDKELNTTTVLLGSTCEVLLSWM